LPRPGIWVKGTLFRLTPVVWNFSAPESFSLTVRKAISAHTVADIG